MPIVDLFVNLLCCLFPSMLSFRWFPDYDVFFFFLSDNKKFMETVESIAESMGKTEEKEGNDATSAAGLLDKLSVGESNSKEEAPKEAASAAAAAEEKPKEETKAEEASSADKA